MSFSATSAGVPHGRRKVGLGFVEVDLTCHNRTLAELVKLVKMIPQARVFHRFCCRVVEADSIEEYLFSL